MSSCSAYGCTNRSARKGAEQLEVEKQKKITFHKFPKDLEKRQQWIKAVRRDNWEPSARSVLCSSHFADECFDRTSLCYVRLWENALPTIFPAFPPHLQKVQRKRKPPHSCVVDATVCDGSTEVVQAKQMCFQQPEEEYHCEESSSLAPSNFESPRKKCLRLKMIEMRRSYRRKLKTIQQKNRRYKKKVAHLDAVIKDLRKKCLIPGEGLDVLQCIGTSNKDLLTRQVAKSKNTSLHRKYSQELRTFAVTLHYYSPRAYCYVRKSFDSCLPHPKTISKWYQHVDGEPGFTAEAFRAVKLRASQEDHEILCSLVFDELAIRKHVEFDGHTYQGFVDTGTGVDNDDRQLAKEALVFLLVAINGSWKVPVGYFLIDGVNSEQKANLVLQCVKLANDTGVRIVSITFDGVSTNFSMAKELGCSFDPSQPLKTWFIPPGMGQTIVIFPDPSHMVKLARNTLGEKRVLVDGNGDLVQWQYFEKLHNIQELEGLHLGNKLKSSHIFFQNQKMKVNLATQLFSHSVADAMEFLTQTLGVTEFQGSAATVRFIRIMNNLFDVLNTKNMRQLDFKKPLHEGNKDAVFEFLGEAEHYLRSLKLNYHPVIQSCRKTGFLGFLICIESLKICYSNLCTTSEPLLKYIPTYKFSQDHIEFFFGNIRMHGGFNNNPTVRQFKSAYKKCLVHMELKPTTTGNAIPLEEITILNCSSANTINLTTPTAYLYCEENVNSLTIEDESDHVYLFNPQEITEYAHHIITYISGFVVCHLNVVIKCENCLSSLSGNSENLLHSLIMKKDRGGLLFPSRDVIAICEACEKVIRTALAESGGKFLLKKFTVARLVCFLMNTYVISRSWIFASLNEHCNDQEPLNDHRLHLIRAIAEKYFEVRVHYICKRSVDKSESKRQVWNKLVLFKGH